jgi:methyltransferase
MQDAGRRFRSIRHSATGIRHSPFNIRHPTSCMPALSALPVTVIVVAAVGVMMVAELQLSLTNERRLRRAGAIEPPGDPYGLMRLAYPLAFVLMGVEGAQHASLSRQLVLWGLVVFGLAKALKFWAIWSLGARWSFRVLVVPGAPLVTDGPYRWFRHPNYVGVLGELAGVALTLSAIVTGALSLAAFAWILRARIKVEERALGMSR